MKKIYVFLPYLTGGGAERVIVNLSNEWAKKYHVKFFVFDLKRAYSKEIKSDVDIEIIPVTKIHLGVWKLLHIIRKERPDVLITSLVYPIFFVAFLKLIIGNKLKVFCRLSNIPSIEIPTIKSRLIKKYFSKILPIYDGVICQSKDMALDLRDFSPRVQNTRIINNPAFLVNSAVENTKSKRKGFTYIGRLTKQKNVSEAIRACFLAKKELNIYGQGELESDLKQLVKDLKAEQYIKFHGFQSNVQEIIIKSEAILLTSNYEGFPNVLLESCALGVPVIAKNVLGGINEIVCNKNGVVYDGDERVLSNILKSFKSEKFSSDLIIEDMKNRFSPQVIAEEYCRFFKI